MKPEIIDCGNGCKCCDGYGVMSLYSGPQNGHLLAPCVECSPRENLDACLARRDAAVHAMERAKEKREIDAHNQRMRELERTP